MAIYIWGNEIDNIYIGTSPVDEVYVGTTKVRPESTPPVWDDYLCFTANVSNSSLYLYNENVSSLVELEISYDKNTWYDYNYYYSEYSHYYEGDIITLSNVGDKIYFRNKSTMPTLFSTSSTSCYRFGMSWSIAVSGDVNYLLCKTSTLSVGDYCFAYLFQWCPITSAPSLPATTLGEDCYYSMFLNCTSLTTASTLPSLTLPRYCYGLMFWGCSSLIHQPTILANTIGQRSCRNMFINCTSLTTAYTIPATTVGSEWYSNMFKWCTSLINPPSLPATTLSGACYYSMFENCTSLNKISALPALTINRNDYENMYNGCSLICVYERNEWWQLNPYRVPTEWTSQLSNTIYMFNNTGGTVTSIYPNQTYYTSNQVV